MWHIGVLISSVVQDEGKPYFGIRIRIIPMWRYLIVQLFLKLDFLYFVIFHALSAAEVWYVATATCLRFRDVHTKAQTSSLEIANKTKGHDRRQVDRELILEINIRMAQTILKSIEHCFIGLYLLRHDFDILVRISVQFRICRAKNLNRIYLICP